MRTSPNTVSAIAFFVLLMRCPIDCHGLHNNFKVDKARVRTKEMCIQCFCLLGSVSRLLQLDSLLGAVRWKFEGRSHRHCSKMVNQNSDYAKEEIPNDY